MKNFLTVLSYWRLLVNGLIITLQLSVIVIALGTILGLLVGVSFTSKSKGLKIISRLYVAIFRGCPLLMQLFMGYFGLAYLGIKMEIFTAVVLVYTLYSGAYIAEIIRSGIESIPKGQWEAGSCISLNSFFLIKDVILPQAFKISFPALIGFYLGLIKDTSVASLVGYSELLREGKTIMSVTSSPFETYLIVGLIYFVICFPLSRFVSYTERRQVV